MSMIFFQVSDRKYKDPMTLVSKDGKHWEAAEPMLLTPSPYERFLNGNKVYNEELGYGAWDNGQGLEEITRPTT